MIKYRKQPDIWTEFFVTAYKYFMVEVF